LGNSERKRPLGKPRHRWVDDTKIDLVEIRCGLVWLGIGKIGELL
jgi:hypothetical protein